MEKLVRTLIIAGVLLIVSVVFCACTMTRVDTGHVGVKVKLAGSDRGVQDMQIKTGWVWYNPLTENIIEFPVSVQNIVLSANKHEGNDPKDEKHERGVDESITFSSVEGVNANADIGFSFHIDPAQAPKLYSRFRQNDMRELAYGYKRSLQRSCFQDANSGYLWRRQKQNA